jgi:hypothetical protein
MRLRKRPGAVTAVAILNIVLGSLALLLGLCGGIVLMVGEDLLGMDPNAGAMNDFLKRNLPSHAVMQIAGLIVLVVQAFLLLFTGIGLLNLQNWARVAALWCAFLSLLWIVFDAFYYVAFTAPVLERFFRDFGGGMGPGPPLRTQVTIGIVVDVVLWLLMSTYAIILICVLMRRSVREVFTDTAGPEEELDPIRDDDDWYAKRRRRDDDVDDYG